ncbi:TPA: fibronectin-binding protein PrtF1/SfbI [Streptococcus pyogenes]|uniref:Fibronectin-binding protein I n=1 Tax=Streptococcus pyogenes TaxID=1314 RepID=Q711B4_STRPY|nr:fibronectin-binding protein PrtF1/SfbI [Streptococcus pyogenes]QCK34810.1 fibronectin-binding protein SfbI [Streptococcus pyogenes]CAC87697.1 fibronectin-binding protein I [Streptococcus pyogenes]VGR44970.1 fibronectin-binding protein I PrtF1/SfbI [Streptococcus pyogenes]VGT44371.1 fibronectin-binding protein I PrtF1/SfbI [Streptococcus pyogenes]VGY77239.1 fibronectin-binding protein I PrtF1/SfbI [Streptococcus pyogenes]
MNNKMFLNKEAGFLAHTKRKRRFAVTLVGVFFMLLACAGAIGFGQVAYAADEKTVPNHSSPNPEFPWYGYDAYRGWFLRYHDLNVNLEGSTSYQVYCFNLVRQEPSKVNGLRKNWFKKVDGDNAVFKKYAANPRVIDGDLERNILNVIYNGYSSDANGIMKGLDRYNAILVTQTAIWYYSDSSPISLSAAETMWEKEAESGDISWEQVKLMREALKKLIDPKLGETVVKKLPKNYKLNIFVSKDESIQNLLSAEYVPDSPPMPGEVPKEESPKEENPKIPDLDGHEIPEVPQEPSDPVIPPVILDGEEVPEVPSESLEPALPPLMPELDGEEVPSESLEPALPPLMPELDGEEVPEVPSESLEPALPPLMPELDGEEIPEVPSESLEPALPPLMPELDGEEVPEKPSIDLPIEVPRYEFNNKDQSPLAGESGETEYITEVYGNQQNPVDIDKKLPNETGFSGNMVETEDTKEPEVLMGGQSESVEFTKDTQTGMSGFSETVTIVEDTRPKLVFHFDNNEPKVEENREKPTKNITPILPATGDIGNVLAFLGILILSVLSIFSLLKNKQNNKV